MILRFSRGEGFSFDVNEYFNSDEFDCKCGKCFTTDVSQTLVWKILDIRESAGCPVVIKSGYRCHAYQEKLRGEGIQTSKGMSTHEAGIAADITTGKHTGKELEMIARSVGFTSIGVAKDWIHVDLRGGERRWEYL